LLKIQEQIKNNPASAEQQNLKFSVKVVNKIATSATQLAKCILLHVLLLIPAAQEQTKTSCSFLTSWYNSIFGYNRLRTIEAENP